ncbi:hypothetical protein D3C75_551500 [compost metagenome]
MVSICTPARPELFIMAPSVDEYRFAESSDNPNCCSVVLDQLLMSWAMLPNVTSTTFWTS